MKSFIRYIGGGFLALAASVGMFRVARGIGVDEEYLVKMLQGVELNRDFETEYANARKQGRIRVQYKPSAPCKAGERIGLSEYFHAVNEKGERLEVTVVGVRSRETKQEVHSVEEGVWILPEAGIYQVMIRCKNAEFEADIPVNG